MRATTPVRAKKPVTSMATEATLLFGLREVWDSSIDEQEGLSDNECSSSLDCNGRYAWAEVDEEERRRSSGSLSF